MSLQTQLDHMDMVETLAKPGLAILESLTPEKCNLWHHMTGVSTEVGELFDAVKKFVIYNKEFDYENALEELGDIEFYLAGIYRALLINRDDALRANMAKLAKRYPNYQYTDQRAHERADKQEVPDLKIYGETDFTLPEGSFGGGDVGHSWTGPNNQNKS